MLDNTRNAWAKTKKDIDILKYVFTYGFNSLLLCYYVFALAFQKGNVVANIILFAMTFASICISLILDKKFLKKEEKRSLKRNKHLFSIVKIITKAYTLGASLYAMYLSTVAVNPVSIILTTLLILLWAISVLVEIIALVLELEYNRMIDAIEKDFHGLIQFVKGTNKVVEGIKETVKGVGEFAHDTATKVAGFFGKTKNKSNNNS